MAEPPSLEAKRYTTKRLPAKQVGPRAKSIDALGEIEFSPCSEEDVEEVDISGLKTLVMFGDIWAPPGEEAWVPVIPFFVSGNLYQQWLDKNGWPGTTGSGVLAAIHENLCLVRGISAKIPMAFLYRYDRTLYKMDDDLRLMASALPEGSIIAMPVGIGTNNGMTYFLATFKTFYSLVFEAQEHASPLHRLARFTFVGRYSHYGSMRATQHLFNFVRVYKNTRDVADCSICCGLKVDTMLPCGHLFCLRCVLDLSQPRQCPQCRAPFTRYNPCYKVIDCSDFVCCRPDCSDVQDKPKQRYIYLPCGHHSAMCETCHERVLAAKTAEGSLLKCKVCGESCFDYCKFFT
jgi:hypothetical protein